MAYIFTDLKAGLPPMTLHDTPATVEVVGATTITDRKVALGKRVRAVDPTFGEGEFIRLLGVASTIVGSVVRWNDTTYQTALVTGVALQKQATPVAVAMSACVAGEHGWYQVSGLAVIKKTAVTFPPNVPIYMSATAGRVKVLTSNGMQVIGATTANVATVTATTSTITVAIDRPHLQGQIT